MEPMPGQLRPSFTLPMQTVDRSHAVSRLALAGRLFFFVLASAKKVSLLGGGVPSYLSGTSPDLNRVFPPFFQQKIWRRVINTRRLFGKRGESFSKHPEDGDI